jgi:hypothetical protein
MTRRRVSERALVGGLAVVIAAGFLVLVSGALGFVLDP